MLIDSDATHHSVGSRTGKDLLARLGVVLTTAHVGIWVYITNGGLGDAPDQPMDLSFWADAVFIRFLFAIPLEGSSARPLLMLSKPMNWARTIALTFLDEWDNAKRAPNFSPRS